MHALKRWVPSIICLAVAMACPAGADDVPENIETAPGVCEAAEGGAAVQVRVLNIRDLEGNIRAQVYGDNPDEFLEKGKKLVRQDDPVVGDEQEVCVQLPSPGRYAIVVMHDRNGNGKADFFSEGFGFSNNPKLGLSKPDAEEVLADFAAGVTRIDVELKYIFGADDDQKKKRRQLRRR